MKLRIAIAAVLLAFTASCRTYYTCPTYADRPTSSELNHPKSVESFAHEIELADKPTERLR